MNYVEGIKQKDSQYLMQWILKENVNRTSNSFGKIQFCFYFIRKQYECVIDKRVLYSCINL